MRAGGTGFAAQGAGVPLDKSEGAVKRRLLLFGAGKRRVAKIEGGATNYYHNDHLSVRLMTDSGGNVAGQQGHYPFGESWYSISTTSKHRFTSYERDSESGNDYAMFRHHVNRLGRFSSPDIVRPCGAKPQRLNRYPYASNNPVNRIDPRGTEDIGALPMDEEVGAAGTDPVTGMWDPSLLVSDGWALSGWNPIEDIECTLCKAKCKEAYLLQMTGCWFNDLWCAVANCGGIDVGDECRKNVTAQYNACMTDCNSQWYCGGQPPMR